MALRDMPRDGEAWRRSLAALDQDATSRHCAVLADLHADDQRDVVQVVQDHIDDAWYGMPTLHVWSLWTRYASAAFYSHPWA